jgi:hypothetical protein
MISVQRRLNVQVVIEMERGAIEGRIEVLVGLVAWRGNNFWKEPPLSTTERVSTLTSLRVSANLVFDNMKGTHMLPTRSSLPN